MGSTRYGRYHNRNNYHWARSRKLKHMKLEGFDMVILHLGQYRDLTLKQASVDLRLLRTLYKRGEMLESVLFSFNKYIPREEFNDSLLRLSRDYKMVEIDPCHFGTRRRVRATALGKSYALDLICKLQAHNASGTC